MTSSIAIPARFARAIMILCAAIVGLTAAVPPVGSGTGLLATYYPTIDFLGPTTVRLDPVVNLSGGSGIQGIGPQNFSVVWRGQLEAQVSEVYTLITESDDGVAVWLDGKPIESLWTLHPATRLEADVALEAGRRYDITIYYFQGPGDSVCQLSWRSASTPEQIVPTSQLYPPEDAVAALAITTDKESYTSPAWVAGTIATDLVAGATGEVNGASTTLTRDGAVGWFLSNARVGDPPGIELRPHHRARVRVRQDARQVDQSIRWKAINLTNLAYGVDNLRVRVGDSLLVTGHHLQGVRIEDGTGAVHDLLRDAGGDEDIPIRLGDAGPQLIAGIQEDGSLGDPIHVLVVGVDWHGPTACEIGFQRTKTFTCLPADAPVSFVAADPATLQMGITGNAGGDVAMVIFPYASHHQVIDARLDGDSGPIIASQQVDSFTLTDSAEDTIAFVAKYPDGSILSQGELTMSPLVRDLDLDIWVFVSGVTFDDSTTAKHVSTDTFTLDPAGDGRFVYRLLRGPDVQTGDCHAYVVSQNGVQVSK